MDSELKADNLHLDLPPTAKSLDGYEFSPAADMWKLSKDFNFSTDFLRELSPETELGFRLTLTRYAEEGSASFAQLVIARFKRFLRATGAIAVTADAILNWRSQLDSAHEYFLGDIRGFLLSWNEYGFPGMPDDVATLLRGLRLKGNETGRAVAQDDPMEGPYSDIELASILGWANGALSERKIELEIYAYLLTLVMTGRRPSQICALRGIDLTTNADAGGMPEYNINFPRGKQTGSGFRRLFRKVNINDDLYQTLCAQHRASAALVVDAVGCDVPGELRREIPVFINRSELGEIKNLPDLRNALNGETPDVLHAKPKILTKRLKRRSAAGATRSERTGLKLHATPRRLRYTFATNLRRQGAAADVIAKALDHSNKKNVECYVKNTVQEAGIINRAVGHKLAPFAQACMGKLVDSERDAIRGDDPRSRVPNHQQNAVGTCGNYSYCTIGYRACYTCVHFQPWVDGPHTEVLDELFEIKRHAAAEGCGRGVVNANDRLILAVQDCINLCDEAKKTRKIVPPVDEQEVLADG